MENISDLNSVKDALWKKASNACEDCYLGYLVWQAKYNFTIEKIENVPFIKAVHNNAFRFLEKTDSPFLKTAVNKLIQSEKSLFFERVTPEYKAFLENNFPGVFSIEEDRGSFDYLYNINALSELSGKKLSKKRNHINGFLSIFKDWHVEEINSSNLSDVLAFAEVWYEKRTGGDSEIGSESLRLEKESLMKFVPLLNELECDGLALYVDGKVSGFTVGQRISEHTYDTVFEKADDGIKGAYNMINREFAKYLRDKYPELKHINRENDLNLPGLRHAKLSYMPEVLLEKYTARIN